MDYNRIIIPFLDNKTIKDKADLFRKKFWDNSVPVDIETIVDIKLKLDVILKLGLQEELDIDAFITSDWKDLY